MEFILIGTMALALVIATTVGQFGANRGFPISSGKRIGHIDGLRGYLALFVMFHHFRIWLSYKAGLPWESLPIFVYIQLGKAGVGLFFMVTGCVFYPRILKGLTGNNWVSIYISRLFRIVPLLLASIFVVSLIIMAETPFRPNRHFPVEVVSWIAGKQVPLMGFDNSYLVNAGVLWSIFYEWLFYVLLLPLCAFLRQMAGTRTWIVPALLLLAALALQVTGRGIFQYAPLFAIGMLAYEVSLRPQAAEKLRSAPATVLAVLCFGLAMNFFKNAYEPAPMALLSVLFVCVACGNSLFGLLQSRGALVLGEASFSIYVLHGIILHLAFRHLPLEHYPITALMGMTIAVSAVSMLTYMAVERPFINLGRQIDKLAEQRFSRRGLNSVVKI